MSKKKPEVHKTYAGRMKKVVTENRNKPSYQKLKRVYEKDECSTMQNERQIVKLKEQIFEGLLTRNI